MSCAPHGPNPVLPISATPDVYPRRGHCCRVGLLQWVACLDDGALIRCPEEKGRVMRGRPAAVGALVIGREAPRPIDLGRHQGYLLIKTPLTVEEHTNSRRVWPHGAELQEGGRFKSWRRYSSLTLTGFS